MKRWILIIMMLSMALGLTSCGGCSDEAVEKALSTDKAQAELKKIAELHATPTFTGTVDESQKTVSEDASFYSYKEFAYGALRFDIDDLVDFFDIEEATSIDSAILTLTRQENHSAYEMGLSVGAALVGESSDYAALTAAYQKASENPILLKTNAEGATADSLDITPLLQQVAKQRSSQPDATGIVVFISMEDATTEHSTEWYGAQGNTPPQLVIQYQQ